MESMVSAASRHRGRLSWLAGMLAMLAAACGPSGPGSGGRAASAAQPEREWFRSPGGRTYHVDSIGGDHSHDGLSPQTAWRTLDRVNRTMFAPGDRLLFRAGARFEGRLDLHGSGAEGQPIVVGRYGSGPRPLIAADGRYPEAVRLHNVEYWELRDLEITNTGATPAPHRTGVLVSLEDFGTAHHIVLQGLYVHDVNSSNRKEEGGAGIRWANGGRRVKSRFDGLRIEDCHLARTDRNGIVGWSEYWRRNEWFPSVNVVIRGNLLEDIGGDGIVPIGCDGALVERNVLRGGRMRAPDYAAGIWPWSCDNTVIQFNEVSGMRGTLDGQGFDADWNCRNTLIQYNYSHDNEGGFALICNDGSVGAPYSIGNVGTIVRYNTSQNDGARTFQISAVEHTAIYNNTVYVGPGREVQAVWFHSWGGWARDTRFSNNILYAEGTMRWEFGASQGSIFEANAFFGRHEGRPADPRAVTADPRLEQPGSGGDGLDSLQGYRLRPGSPCLGAGVPIPSNGGRDFWGNPVPAGGPPDIGAHQSAHEAGS